MKAFVVGLFGLKMFSWANNLLGEQRRQDESTEKHEDLQSAFNKADIMNKWKINVLPETIINNFWELLLLFLLSLYQENAFVACQKSWKIIKVCFVPHHGTMVTYISYEQCLWSRLIILKNVCYYTFAPFVVVCHTALFILIAIGYAHNLQRNFLPYEDTLEQNPV